MGLVHYTSAKAFLFDYWQEKDFDILLLDVEMPEIYTKFNEIVGDKTAIYISPVSYTHLTLLTTSRV